MRSLALIAPHLLAALLIDALVMVTQGILLICVGIQTYFNVRSKFKERDRLISESRRLYSEIPTTNISSSAAPLIPQSNSQNVEPIRLKKIDFVGCGVIKEFRKIPLKIGTDYSPDDLKKGLRDSVAVIQDEYFEKGHMDASVRAEVVHTGDITFSINEGIPTVLGSLSIIGNTVTPAEKIKEVLLIKEGDCIDGHLLRESKKRLYDLGIFSQIRFNTAGRAKGTINLEIAVEEAKRNEFSFGGGYKKLCSLRLPFMLGLSSSMLLTATHKIVLIAGLIFHFIAFIWFIRALHKVFLREPFYYNFIRLIAVRHYLLSDRLEFSQQEAQRTYSSIFAYLIFYLSVAFMLFAFISGLSYLGLAKILEQTKVTEIYGTGLVDMAINCIYYGFNNILFFDSVELSGTCFKLLQIFNMSFALYLTLLILNFTFSGIENGFDYFKKYYKLLEQYRTAPLKIDIFQIIGKSLFVGVSTLIYKDGQRVEIPIEVSTD